MSPRHVFLCGAIATFIAAAIPAAAQVNRSIVPGPVVAPPPAARGITVNGSAAASAPATSARITLYLVSRNNTVAYTTQAVQPVIDAMVKAGVDRNSITLPLNFSAPGNSSSATITGSVEHPTLAQLQNGIVTVGTAINGIPGAILQNVNVELTLGDCEPLVDKARSGAITRARAKADDIAKQLNVKLGSVQAVNAANELQLRADGSCMTMLNFNPFQAPTFEQTGDYLNVTVSSAVTITYGMR